MTATDELKPCPFCGGKAHTFHNYLWHVRCDGTGGNYYCVMGFGAFVTEAEAIAAWNRRAETVELRTCKLIPDNHHRVDKVTTSWGCVCSACGGFHKYTHGKGWAFCPSCGREVVDG